MPTFKLTDPELPRNPRLAGRPALSRANFGFYTVPEDVTEKLADGRVIVVAHKGAQIPMAEARRLGLVKDSAPAGPAEVKSEAAAEPAIAEPVPDATEAAADLAAEHGIDLATVRGTGAGGKIIKSDVEALLD